MYRNIPSLREVAQPADGYFRDINEGGLLSAEEERQLAEDIAAGDMDADFRDRENNQRSWARMPRFFEGSARLCPRFIDSFLGRKRLV